MSSPWKKMTIDTHVGNLSDIMSEEYAKGLQVKENMRFAEEISNDHVNKNAQEVAPQILEQIENTNLKEYCDSDAIIAKVLQCQFDKEHDEELSRVEKKRNGDSKVSLSLDNYRTVPKSLIFDTDDEDEIEESKDWDRFETNEKEFAKLPKRGYIMKDGEMVTKHDSVITGRRNAGRVMAFPPEICTGDGAGFDMKLPNSVYNHLKEHSKIHQARRHKMMDRKETQATAEMGIDESTRLILLKLINNNLLESVNGIVSTGKESVVLHANGDPSFPDFVIPKDCAIKVYKTTLNEFKTRDKYIEDDYRFRDRFSKQNPRKVVHMWAEKEMHNLMRLQRFGINCPEMVCLKKHVLVMSFIGKDANPAPKLKNVNLEPEKWQMVYDEVVEAMHKMFNMAWLIHADLSEYNILWWKGKCWFIDVSQSVQPDHPNGLKFLLRDCQNITNFFEKKVGHEIKTADELFMHITGYKEVDVNFLEGVHSTYNNLASRFDIAPDDNRNIKYPFDYCWQKTNDSNLLEGDSDEDEISWDTAKNFDKVHEVFKKENVSKKYIHDEGVNFANEISVPVLERDKPGKSKK